MWMCSKVRKVLSREMQGVRFSLSLCHGGLGHTEKDVRVSKSSRSADIAGLFIFLS
jgi:hypothetical protein